jgi:predicted amidohydrolase
VVGETSLRVATCQFPVSGSPKRNRRYIRRLVRKASANKANIVHSFYNARFDGPNILDEYTPALLRCRAADNTMWVVANNSSARHSCWATRIVRPDGAVAGRLEGPRGGNPLP